jgi:hypothetical protein
MKANIEARVRAKLNEIGLAAAESKLLWIMNVRTLGQMDAREEDLGDGIKATPREIRDWVNEKKAREALWIRIGVIAAVIAAVFAFLAWRFPIN